MESSTQMFGADTAGARLSHTCSPAHAHAPVHHGLPYPLCSGNDSLDVRFPSMIRFSQTAAVRDVMDSRDR